MEQKRYLVGRIEKDGMVRMVWDTRFDYFEEAADWGMNHGCTHVYDVITDEFEEI